MNPSILIKSIQPTVFFHKTQDELRQKVTLTLESSDEVDLLNIFLEYQQFHYETSIMHITKGSADYTIFIPDIQSPTKLFLTLTFQNEMVQRIEMDWMPTRHWQVHLVHGSHHDLGYTDLPTNILKEHASFMDMILDFCDATDNWPEDSQFRYLVEQAWSIRYYLHTCSEKQTFRLINRIKQNRIEVTALYGNETTELCSQEELIRLLYPAFRLQRDYGISITSAELNDIPGVAWGMASVLAGAGIRYFAPGLPDYYAWGEKVHAWWDEKAVLPRDTPGAFWWEGPDNEKVLFWHEGGAIGWTSMWSYEQTMDDLGQKLSYLTSQKYPYDILRIKFHSGHRDNSPPDSRISLIARQWNDEWAFPRLIVSTNYLFFTQFENAYGDKLPTIHGDIPNTDYHLGAASTARETADNRQTHDLILSAEKFAACAAMLTNNPYPAEMLAEATDSMLMYDEHTWGMAHPIGPAQNACWAQKSEFAYRAQALAHDVLVKSLNQIADQIQLDKDVYHIIVFNPLSFPNTSPVVVEAVPYAPCSRPMYWKYPQGADGSETPILVHGTALGRDLVSLPTSLLKKPFKLIDLSSNQEVSHQIRKIEITSPHPFAGARSALSQTDPVSVGVLNFSDAQQYDLLFTAHDVPPVGYKTYRIVESDQPVHDSYIEYINQQPILENQYYSIKFNPENGAISSLIDKETDLELVDSTSNIQFNQLVARVPKTGQIATPYLVATVSFERGRVVDTAKIVSNCLGCPQVVQEVILHHEVKRIDFHTWILRDNLAPLEVFLAFPLFADQPTFQYDGNYSVIRPIQDQLPGTNTDSYAIQHWLQMSDNQRKITLTSLDAGAVCIGKLWTGAISQAHLASLPQDFGREFLRDPSQFEKGHIYSCLMLNNFRTNFQPVQSGEFLFRHSLTSATPSKEPDWQFGWKVSQPLQSVILNSSQPGNLPFSTSFFQVLEPNIHLLTMKAAEDGNGLILRLAILDEQPFIGNINLPYYEIKKATLTSLIETDLTDLPFGKHRLKVTLPGNKIITIRCCGKQFPRVKDGLLL